MLLYAFAFGAVALWGVLDSVMLQRRARAKLS
jgi:uncharacterized membrane protein